MSCFACRNGQEAYCTCKTTEVSKSELNDLLVWQGVECVNKEGWYWVKDEFGEKRIVFIRRYSKKWCITNWEISEKAEYCGPIPEPH